MKYLRASLAFVLVVALTATAAAFAAPGDLDPTFGAGGVAYTSIAGVPNAHATDVALWPDGRMLATGVAGDVFLPPLVPAFVRYLSDGSLDATLGTGGILLLGAGTVNATVVDPTGGFVTAGSGLEITRYADDGSLDLSFGAGGSVTVGGGSTVIGLVRNGDGTLVAAANTATDVRLVRLFANGTLDASFGAGGIVQALAGLRARDLVVQPDGKPVLLVTDASLEDPTVVRFEANGALDGGFGDDGVAALTPALGGGVLVEALALHPDGRIVVAGYSGLVVLVRLRSNGDVDPTFGSGGVVATDLGDSALITAAIVQADGKLLVGGSIGQDPPPSGTSSGLLARYHPDGILDTTFGSAGAVVSGLSRVARLVAQPDGKVLHAAIPTGVAVVFTNAIAVSRIESLTVPCGATPATGCKTVLKPRASRLSIDDAAVDAKDKLQLTWKKGEATSLAEIGDPVASDDQTLCLYDESGPSATLLLGAFVEAGGLCKGNKPCWKTKGRSGFGFRDRERHRFGVDTLKLKAGAAGKPKILLKAKGASIPTPALPLPLPVRAQIVSETGACWEAVFSTTGTTRNDATRFRAKSD